MMQNKGGIMGNYPLIRHWETHTSPSSAQIFNIMIYGQGREQGNKQSSSNFKHNSLSKNKSINRRQVHHPTLIPYLLHRSDLGFHGNTLNKLMENTLDIIRPQLFRQMKSYEDWRKRLTNNGWIYRLNIRLHIIP